MRSTDSGIDEWAALSVPKMSFLQPTEEHDQIAEVHPSFDDTERGYLAGRYRLLDMSPRDRSVQSLQWAESRFEHELEELNRQYYEHIARLQRVVLKRWEEDAYEEAEKQKALEAASKETTNTAMQESLAVPGIAEGNAELSSN